MLIIGNQLSITLVKGPGSWDVNENNVLRMCGQAVFSQVSSSYAGVVCKNGNIPEVELRLKVECGDYFDLVPENVDDLLTLCSKEKTVFEFVYKSTEVCGLDESANSTITVCASEPRISTETDLSIPGNIQSHSDLSVNYQNKLNCEYAVAFMKFSILFSIFLKLIMFIFLGRKTN